MRDGDHIGIGSEKQVDLLAEVRNITPEYVEFWVINGAWHGRLFSSGKMQCGVHNGETFNVISEAESMRVVFGDFVPPKFRKDYNDEILYMNSRIQIPPVVRWLKDLLSRLLNRKEALAKRFGKACSAFMRSWRGEHLVNIDDTIPF